MQVRNLAILVACQFISTTGSIVVVTLGGIVGATLTTNKAFATLPMSMLIVGIAVSTVPAVAIPATMLMRRIGRRAGFGLASACAVVALLIVVLALNRSNFALFVVGAMMFGINMAFTAQYRYAAAESVAPRLVPRA